jgi:hypothetical protein
MRCVCNVRIPPPPKTNSPVVQKPAADRCSLIYKYMYSPCTTDLNRALLHRPPQPPAPSSPLRA